MKMDLKGLCSLLAQAAEEESVPSQDCSSYLLENVLRPLMRDETILLKDIDFSRFDLSEVHILGDYYEGLEMQGQKLNQIVGVIARIEPSACKARRFC